MPLAGDWSLWRDFAVRSAGFPVDGLDVFGPGDEGSRLRDVAARPDFVEAVTWQNPAAVANAVARVAAEAGRPSDRRRREAVVASYWQRYCAKNDTIGFFGPLAWGRIDDDAEALAFRSHDLERERVIHLEAWGVQALAETIDPELRIATGPHAERDLRRALEEHPDERTRELGLPMLDRLESALRVVAEAPRESLADALAALDATFVELTGRAPSRNAGRAYGARTLAYVDSMRDLDVVIGPGLVDAMRPALRALFEACRWYCGRVQRVGRRIVEESLPESGAPLGPMLGQVIRRLMEPPSELADVVEEFEHRLSQLLADPDPKTIEARAVAAFADHEPAWRTSVFQSVDIQLAIADGEPLAVVGDVHPGGNPLVQGLFAHRHPDQSLFWDAVSADLGREAPMLLPPFGPGFGVDGRTYPATSDAMLPLAVLPETRAQDGRRTWLPHELFVAGKNVVDRSGTLCIPVVDAFGMAIFISGVRVFELLPEAEHAPRVAIGSTVIRRESWSIPVAELPTRPEDVAAFARDRAMPRRLFAKSPLERKPMYLDTESPVLARIFCRHARHAATEAPEARFRFSEMLPTPEQCWLTDADGGRYVSEFRFVAVDRTRRPATTA
jgi:Lantibiotic dehydratase, N terminus